MKKLIIQHGVDEFSKIKNHLVYKGLVGISERLERNVAKFKEIYLDGYFTLFEHKSYSKHTGNQEDVLILRSNMSLDKSLREKCSLEQAIKTLFSPGFKNTKFKPYLDLTIYYLKTYGVFNKSSGAISVTQNPLVVRDLLSKASDMFFENQLKIVKQKRPYWINHLLYLYNLESRLLLLDKVSNDMKGVYVAIYNKSLNLYIKDKLENISQFDLGFLQVFIREVFGHLYNVSSLLKRNHAIKEKGVLNKEGKTIAGCSNKITLINTVGLKGLQAPFLKLNNLYLITLLCPDLRSSEISLPQSLNKSLSQDAPKKNDGVNINRKRKYEVDPKMDPKMDSGNCSNRSVKRLESCDNNEDVNRQLYYDGDTIKKALECVSFACNAGYLNPPNISPFCEW